MQEAVRDAWKKAATEAIRSVCVDAGYAADGREVPAPLIEVPPRPELGDIAIPMFSYAKLLRKAPPQIAKDVAARIACGAWPGVAAAEGPYVNVRLAPTAYVGRIVGTATAEADAFGRGASFEGQKVMVEFSCPNTNKPLHLGHLRNDAIGASVAEILAACGAEVRKVNLVNDRGVHICKSMLAYKLKGNGKTPESEGIKSDHFVGDYYVLYNTMAKDDPTLEERIREMLLLWEAGDPATRELWKTMNGWAVGGIEETYRKTGISFDQIYFESETYDEGRKEVLRGLESGIFFRKEDGSVWVDCTGIGLDQKVLLRGDGTTLYVTQDIGTAASRHRDWPFDRLIYVVGAEQQYHFKVLFHVLGLLGHEWAKRLHHLSYGLVNLPEGRMKSREGTVVDADDILEELSRFAVEEIREKEREEAVGDLAQTSRRIALGALNYFLLQVSPNKDMIFNPKESLSFNGDTGPYLQYMGARISNMIRKYEERKTEFGAGRFDAALLSAPEEWELAKAIGMFPDVVAAAGRDLDPSRLCAYLYDLARLYSRYYHDYRVLQNEDPSLVVSRIELAKALLQTLKNAFRLLGIPFLGAM